ncbi:MAG TPA: hypothetical protein VNX68_17900 [Nitrosopumilaceae archaeon]|jgi:hypothetical protein|nr:hypothetical protein [Nitrosopumilaceae archaeon]
MGLVEVVKAEYVAEGHDYVKLANKYADEMKTHLEPFGGSLGDLPVDKDHPFHATQAKLSALHDLNKNGELPVVPKEEVVNKEEEFKVFPELHPENAKNVPLVSANSNVTNG